MRTPTGSQQRAIDTADKHVLVNAGAGSGKTTTVIGRILHLIGTGIPLNRIAAITFTNAAAADLKRRLRQELRASGHRQLAQEVAGARVGTIHSFCADVLREFSLRAGTAPGFVALEESEATSLKREAVHNAFLTAIEEAAAGVTELLAVHPMSNVEGWLLTLTADTDRLDRFVARREALGPHEQIVLDLALRASAAVSAALEQSGSIDFDRMITHTRNLLRDHADVRRILQQRIHTLIVDEFQDVDPAQKEIAWLLGEPESGRNDSTRLLLVGDPKQSIFRFRRADVTLWSEVAATLEAIANGEVISLADNFRSVPEILGFVDNVIGPILDTPIAGSRLQPFEAPFQPLLPAGAVARKLGGPAIELLVVPADGAGKTEKADVVRAAEADKVAARALEFHHQGVPWREMAVLLSGWGGIEIYEGALRAAGVPTYALRTEGFYQCREVQDLILALETVRDPRDDRALLGFLRSPFAGVKDETLLAIARQGSRPLFDHAASVVTAEQEVVEAGIELVTTHAALRDRLPLHELLESLVEESGYLAHLAMRGDEGAQPLANVRKFVALARQHAALNVGDFLRLIRDTIASETRVGEARLHGEADDVVVLTSVHSAKGLEWRVVFWCDLIRAGRNDNTTTILLGRDSFVLKVPDVESKEQPEPWPTLKAAEQMEADAERKRLWYVAATRAEERLVLGGLPLGTGRTGGAAGALLPRLGEIAGDDGAQVSVGTDALPAQALVLVADPDGGTAEAEAAEESDDVLLSRLPVTQEPLAVAAGRPRHSATELLTWQRCQTKHWFRYLVGIKEPEVERGTGGYVAAITRGQIVHDVLESLEEEGELDSALEAAIARNDDDAPARESAVGAAYRQKLRDEVALVASQADYRALADRPGARRELPFLHLPAGEDFTEGKIDLASPGRDDLVLLDVKTSPVTKEGAARKAAEYALQRDVYVAAAEAIGGIDVARFAFQFGQAETQISEPVTPALRARLHAELPSLLASLGSGTRALAVSATDCDYCGYRSAGWCPGVTGAPAE